MDIITLVKALVSGLLDAEEEFLEHLDTFSTSCLKCSNRYAILTIEEEEPETHGLPPNNYDNCFIQPFTIGSSGRLLSFTLGYLI